MLETSCIVVPHFVQTFSPVLCCGYMRFFSFTFGIPSPEVMLLEHRAFASPAAPLVAIHMLLIRDFDRSLTLCLLSDHIFYVTFQPTNKEATFAGF